MRLAGRITDWNDGKGFGFVLPYNGGTRTFVHISQFQRGSRRPVAGDLILYVPVVDERGRSNAQQIRYAGAKVETVRAPSRLPRAALGISALAFGTVAYAMGVLPPVLLAVYLGASARSYWLYRADKSAAKYGRSRIPENTLHMADLLSGWPGALIAQHQFHHKTVKQPFQFVFWLTVVLNLAACVWLVRSGLAVELTKSLIG